MAKKVLVLCTGNSCRSIIAEALINRTFDGKIAAYSSGVSASGMVTPSAKKILQSKNSKLTIDNQIISGEQSNAYINSVLY